MATDIDTDIDINTFRYLYEIINVVGKKIFFLHHIVFTDNLRW